MWQVRAGRLFDALGLPQDELQRLVLNLAQATPPRGTRLGDTAPLPPRSFEQLGLLGLSPATLQTLRPYATWIPGRHDVKVNLNTASAEVIFAVAAGDLGRQVTMGDAVKPLDMTSARQLVDTRARAYFKNLGMARMALGGNANEAVLDDQYFLVNSNFFEARGRLRLDKLALEEVSMLYRTGSTVMVMSRQRTALTAPPPGGMDFSSLQAQGR